MIGSGHGSSARFQVSKAHEQQRVAVIVTTVFLNIIPIKIDRLTEEFLETMSAKEMKSSNLRPRLN